MGTIFEWDQDVSIVHVWFVVGNHLVGLRCLVSSGVRYLVLMTADGRLGAVLILCYWGSEYADTSSTLKSDEQVVYSCVL